MEFRLNMQWPWISSSGSHYCYVKAVLSIWVHGQIKRDPLSNQSQVIWHETSNARGDFYFCVVNIPGINQWVLLLSGCNIYNQEHFIHYCLFEHKPVNQNDLDDVIKDLGLSWGATEPSASLLKERNIVTLDKIYEFII